MTAGRLYFIMGKWYCMVGCPLCFRSYSFGWKRCLFSIRLESFCRRSFVWECATTEVTDFHFLGNGRAIFSLQSISRHRKTFSMLFDKGRFFVNWMGYPFVTRIYRKQNKESGSQPVSSLSSTHMIWTIIGVFISFWKRPFKRRQPRQRHIG